MNWAEELIDLYDKNKDKIGVIEKRIYQNKKITYTLLPLFHTSVSAVIEVTIDSVGNLLNIAPVAQDDAFTVIPVYKDSEARSSNICAHPLNDEISYLAGDCSGFVKTEEAKVRKKHKDYMDKLRKWIDSDYSHPKLNAIYQYLSKNTLIADLKDFKIPFFTNGYLDDKKLKANIRFVVRGCGEEERTWKDQTLFQAFIDYNLFLHRDDKKDIDYMTGREEIAVYSGIKKVSRDNSNAKLMSSNDSSNFSFLGRFAKVEEAFSLGYESSQKAQLALKWLNEKQGVSFNNMEVIIWESSLNNIPAWDAATKSIIEDDSDDDVDDFDDDELLTPVDGNQVVAKKLHRVLQGYRENINGLSNIRLIILEWTGDGRLSMTACKMLDIDSYLKNIEKWHNQCSWNYTRKQYGVPSVTRITNILYGHEVERADYTRLELKEKSMQKHYNRVYKELLPCIWNNAPLPEHLMRKAVFNASNPISYPETYDQVLGLACCFVKKFRFDRYKEEWNMALNETCTDRSYLYGRLLAIADKAERSVIESSDPNNKRRITNAKKYMVKFSQQPYSTWKVIEESLQPYLAQSKYKGYYESLINKVCDLFDYDDFINNSSLDGLYLLGYHCQLSEFYKKKSEKPDDETEEE